MTIKKLRLQNTQFNTLKSNSTYKKLLTTKNKPHPYHNHLIHKIYKNRRNHNYTLFIKNQQQIYTLNKSLNLITQTVQKGQTIYIASTIKNYQIPYPTTQIKLINKWLPGLITNTSFKKQNMPSLIITINTPILDIITKETNKLQIPTINFQNFNQNTGTYSITLPTNETKLLNLIYLTANKALNTNYLNY